MQVETPTGLYASHSDLKIMALIFKWKIAPMFIIKASLHRGEKEQTFEKRVHRLVRRGLIQKVDHLGEFRFFQLTEKGFLRFKQTLDGLKEDGFASEAMGHDFLSLAMQLGAWAHAKPKSVEIVSEQEMRRFNVSELPSWLPSLDGHRPDGFTRFKHGNKSRILAYEIEINAKHSERYISVMQYYNRRSDIDLVLWLVKNNSHRKLIIDTCVYVDKVSLSKHAFILLDDFKSSHWDAMVEFDQKPPMKLGNLMYRFCQPDVQGPSALCLTTGVSDFLKYLVKY